MEPINRTAFVVYSPSEGKCEVVFFTSDDRLRKAGIRGVASAVKVLLLGFLWCGSKCDVSAGRQRLRTSRS